MKTAVEWLVEQICTEVEMHDEYGNVSHIEFWNAFISCTDLSEYINQAKQMEKEQIENSFENGVEYGYDCYHSNEWAEEPTYPNFEQYYNETYKNTNE